MEELKEITIKETVVNYYKDSRIIAEYQDEHFANDVTSQLRIFHHVRFNCY